jgi:cytochrome c
LIAPLTKKRLLFILWFVPATFVLPGCKTQEQEPEHKKKDYIKRIAGINEPVPPDVLQLGEVLIAYSDCYTCHTLDERSKGPAFMDIAKRYPVNQVFIEMLAQKVIAGGSGSWGAPVMDPHPNLSPEDARAMVSYILSLEK